MRILTIGSGPERIGKTGHYDRFALQALQFLMKEGHEVVWVDDNPATLTSCPDQTKRVYLEPLNLKLLEEIIEQEKPDGILPTFGGDLAMHLLVFLDRDGIIDRHGVQVLGTSIKALKRLLDEEVLKKNLCDLGIPFIETEVAHNIEECIRLCQSIGFPVILRPAFGLEGLEGYLVYNIEEVERFARFALNLSPVKEVVIQKMPLDWIQLAIEVVHDPGSPGKAHLVGTLEALEGGSGVHMGNSVVITPSLTMKGELLEKALDWAGIMARNLEICGSFQVRFVLSPNHSEIFVSRVIHGFSRFSLFLSILGCMPLGQINAALSLGISHEDLKQKLKLGDFGLMEQMGPFFVRVPVFLDSLLKTDNLLPTMLSMGTSIFLGQTPTTALGKALDYMFESDFSKKSGDEEPDFEGNDLMALGAKRLLKFIQKPDMENMEFQAKPFEFNPAVLPLLDEISSMWSRLRNVEGDHLPAGLIRQAKVMGLSNSSIAKLTGLDEKSIDEKCSGENAHPVLKSLGQDADNYRNKLCFLSYPINSIEEEPGFTHKRTDKGSHSLLFLGPGPFTIGWGTEIDQVLLKTIINIKDQGHRIFLINNNPDSLSLDPGVLDGICLETPSIASIQSALDKWPIDSLVHQFCPSIPEGLEDLLKARGIRISGTPLDSLRKIQDIKILWKILEETGIPLMRHSIVTEPDRALSEAARLGYPVLVRLTNKYLNPAAGIIYDEAMFRHFLNINKKPVSKQMPIFIEKFQEGMISIQVLAIGDGQEAIPLAFIENIEEHGVHSGDCASIIPTLSLGDFHKSIAKDALNSIVAHFGIVGHVHMDLAIKGRSVYVTGLWPYPSQNIPFLEKSMRHLINDWNSKLFLGHQAGDLKISQQRNSPDRFYVKESVFPYTFFPDLDPILSPQMRSTGQVLGNECSFGKAYLKSQIAVNPKLPHRDGVFISVRDSEKEACLQIARKLLELGYTIVSTQGTAQFLTERGIEVFTVHKVSGLRPNIIDLIKNGEISLVINIPEGLKSKVDEQVIRRVTIEHNVPLVTTTSGAFLIVRGFEDILKSPFSYKPLEI